MKWKEILETNKWKLVSSVVLTVFFFYMLDCFELWYNDPASIVKNKFYCALVIGNNPASLVLQPVLSNIVMNPVLFIWYGSLSLETSLASKGLIIPPIIDYAIVLLLILLYLFLLSYIICWFVELVIKRFRKTKHRKSR